MRKICLITGTRAEWGLLSGLAKRLCREPDIMLQIVATNMHLSAKYGHTIDEIRAFGFEVDAEIPMLDDEAVSCAKENVRAMGREMLGLADVFAKLKPDLVVILGDRYEMLVAASAALIFGIPIAHLYGGERTEGAFDDSIRHAITKMSALHFTSTAEYRNRVIQMGEHPERVFFVGAIGCENIRLGECMSRADLEQSLGFKITDKCFLITYHPVTLNVKNGSFLVQNLISALETFPDYKILITHPNSDKGCDEILSAFKAFAGAQQGRVKLVSSLGVHRYLSAIPLMKAVIGNSSSGLIEVPSFGIPTVNIGPRQEGRTRGLSVIDSAEDASSIRRAIGKAVSADFQRFCRSVVNPYEKPGTIASIARVLTTVDLAGLKHKQFYDLPGGSYV